MFFSILLILSHEKQRLCICYIHCPIECSSEKYTTTSMYMKFDDFLKYKDNEIDVHVFSDKEGFLIDIESVLSSNKDIIFNILSNSHPIIFQYRKKIRKVKPNSKINLQLLDLFNDSKKTSLSDTRPFIHSKIQTQEKLNKIDDNFNCGESATYSYDGSTKTLTISGTGEMYDFESSKSQPWSSFQLKIKTIIINDGITKIGNHAFHGCFFETSITIPSSVTYIGENAFESNNEITTINIPNSVTYIGSYAFNHCKSVKKINIPEGITSIGDYTFNGCDEITSLIIPTTVTSIGDFAIACPKITSIIIPNKVKSIGNDAFRSTLITSILIPDSVESIGDRVFSVCSKLQKVDVCENSKHFISIDGVLFNKEITKLFCYPNDKKDTSYSIPDTVTQTAEEAFDYPYHIESLTISDSFTEISLNFFSGFYGLKFVKLGSKITANDMGKVLRKCNILESVEVSEENQNYASFSGSLYSKDFTTLIYVPPLMTDEKLNLRNDFVFLGDGAFAHCKYITSITLPPNLKKINVSSFNDCTNLTSVIMPEGLLEICFASFTRSQVKSINIPDSVIKIENSAFSNMNALEFVKIPSSIKRLEDYTFYQCENLKSITLPNSIEYIGKFVFANCIRLEYINIPERVRISSFFLRNTIVRSLVIPAGVQFLSSGSFENCTQLSSLSFLGYEQPRSSSPTVNFFNQFKKLEVVHVPPEYIGDTFGGMPVLKDLSFNGICGDDLSYSFDLTTSKLSISGSGAMNDYSSEINNPWMQFSGAIKSIEIEEGVESLGSYSFNGCSSLTSISIPKSVILIDDNAFSGLINLESIEVSQENVNYMTNEGILYSKDGTKLILYPACKDETSIILPDKINEIKNSAFYGNKKLESITIPNSITKIGEQAFRDCISLTSFSVSETNPNYAAINGVLYSKATGSLRLLEQASDNNNNNLDSLLCYPVSKQDESFTIPVGIVSIEKYAFSKASIKTIEIKSQIKNIGTLAFIDCINLKTINYESAIEPASVLPVFENCYHLQKVNVPINYKNNQFCGHSINRILDEDSSIEPDQPENPDNSNPSENSDNSNPSENSDDSNQSENSDNSKPIENPDESSPNNPNHSENPDISDPNQGEKPDITSNTDNNDDSFVDLSKTNDSSQNDDETNNSPNENKKNKTAIIAGSVCAVVVVVIIIIVVLVVYFKKLRHTNTQPSENEGDYSI